VYSNELQNLWDELEVTQKKLTELVKKAVGRDVPDHVTHFDFDSIGGDR
jgi:hypothetical protein